jgi:hypothetical protein
MSHDDTRPTVQLIAEEQRWSGRVTLTLTLPEIRLMQLCYPGVYDGDMVGETVAAMKKELDQKLYGDAQRAVEALRHSLRHIYGVADRTALIEAINTIEEKLQLRANLDITEL